MIFVYAVKLKLKKKFYSNIYEDNFKEFLASIKQNIHIKVCTNKTTGKHLQQIKTTIIYRTMKMLIVYGDV